MKKDVCWAWQNRAILLLDSLNGGEEMRPVGEVNVSIGERRPGADASDQILRLPEIVHNGFG